MILKCLNIIYMNLMLGQVKQVRGTPVVVRSWGADVVLSQYKAEVKVRIEHTFLHDYVMPVQDKKLMMTPVNCLYWLWLLWRLLQFLFF
jgi:hypothetical protein